jgi:hypothetical protein
MTIMVLYRSPLSLLHLTYHSLDDFRETQGADLWGLHV